MDISLLLTIIGVIFSIVAAISTMRQYYFSRRTEQSQPTKSSVRRNKAHIRDDSCENLIGKIVRWVMFSIFLSLLPLCMKILSLSTRNHDFHWDAIISRGELLFIIVAMCTTAIAELLCSGSDSKILKLILGSLTITVLIIASGYYSDISVAFELKQTQDFNQQNVFIYQLWLFGVSFLLGIFCIILSEN